MSGFFRFSDLIFLSESVGFTESLAVPLVGEIKTVLVQLQELFP